MADVQEVVNKLNQLRDFGVKLLWMILAPAIHLWRTCVTCPWMR